MSDRLKLIYADPKSLDAHPSNWKVHPESQSRALDAAIYGTGRADGRKVGWASALVFNNRTKRLLDGHARRMLAISRNEVSVPVLVGEWSESEEREILATLDPLGYGAEIDPESFERLTQGWASGSPELDDLVKAMHEAGDLLKPAAPDPTDAAATPLEGASLEGGDPASAAEDLAVVVDVDPFDVPDGLFASDNRFGIPALDPRLEAEVADFPVTTWGTVGHRVKQTGTYHFYTDDKRFSPLWQDPSKVLVSGCPSVVEPNFSTHEQTPLVVSLWAIYRKRWLARWWQAKGLRVFVDLNVHHSLLHPHEAFGGERLNLLGVPPGWRSFATRAHGNRPELLDVEYAVALGHAGGRTPYFLVVGGGEAVKALCLERAWAHVPESSESARAGKAKVKAPRKKKKGADVG